MVEIIAGFFAAILFVAMAVAVIAALPGFIWAFTHNDFWGGLRVIGSAEVRMFGLIYRILVIILSVVAWVFTGLYNLLRNRALPGLPDIGGAGSGKASGAHDLQRDPTAPVVHRSKATAKEQLEAIREGRYGDLMFFGRHLDGWHALICAKTRSGKSQAILIAFLAWCYISRPESNTITLDPKAEFYDEHRRRGGKHFNYSVMEKHPDERVSAINVVPDGQAARGLIETLTDDDSGYFVSAARNLFVQLCRASGHRSVIDVYDLLYDGEALERLAEGDKQLTAILHGKNEKRIDDIIDTLRTALSMLDDPLVRRVFDSRGREEPDFSAGGVHVYICIPLIESFADAFSPWATALMDRLVTLASGCGRDTYLVLDEAASFMDVKRLAGYFAMSAGAGIRVILSVQDLSQMQDRIGREKTRSVVNNSSYRITGPLTEPETARILSEVSGEVELERLVEGKPGDAGGMFPECAGEGRHYHRNTRNRLTTSNINSLNGEWFLDAGQSYRIDQIEPEKYGTFSDQLPDGWEEDLRGVPPRDGSGETPTAADIIAEAEEITEAHDPDAPETDPAGEPQEATIQARRCGSCGERVEASEVEQGICETCGEEP